MKYRALICVVCLLSVCGYQAFRINKLENAVKIKAKELLQDLRLFDIYPMTQQCTLDLSAYQALGSIPEPEDVKNDDIFTRVEMLRQHLNYNPSPQWVDDVLVDALQEIATAKSERLHTERRRESTMKEDDRVLGPCTYIHSVPIKKDVNTK